MQRPTFLAAQERFALGEYNSRAYSLRNISKGDGGPLWHTLLNLPKGPGHLVSDSIDTAALAILTDALGDRDAAQALADRLTETLQREGLGEPGGVAEIGQTGLITWARHTDVGRDSSIDFWGARYVAVRNVYGTGVLSVEFHTGRRFEIQPARAVDWGRANEFSRNLAAGILSDMTGLPPKQLEEAPACQLLMLDELMGYPTEVPYIEISKPHILQWMRENSPELVASPSRGLEL